jgi:hypothetical protein
MNNDNPRLRTLHHEERARMSDDFFFFRTNETITTHDERIGELIKALRDSCDPTDQRVEVIRAGVHFLREDLSPGVLDGALDAFEREHPGLLGTLGV